MNINKILHKVLKFLFCILLVFTTVSSLKVNAKDNTELQFSNIYSNKARGEIKIIGNVLVGPDKTLYNEQKIKELVYQNPNGDIPKTINNNVFQVNLDLDNDANTRNSTSVKVSIGPKDQIDKAFLVWGATVSKGNDLDGKTGLAANQAEVNAGPVIKFKTPKMGSYTTISPVKRNQFSGAKQDYTAYADVTELVRAGGSGNRLVVILKNILIKMC